MNARGLDNDEFVLVASLDLCSALDVVDTKLLLKRWKIIGLYSDIISLIEFWLCKRYYFVSIDENNFCLFDLLLGTVQGSILDPILYVIFVSPIFVLELLFSFADNTYAPKSSKNLTEAIKGIEKYLEAITQWFDNLV
jgi:hypothetical protein